MLYWIRIQLRNMMRVLSSSNGKLLVMCDVWLWIHSPLWLLQYICVLCTLLNINHKLMSSWRMVPIDCAVKHSLLDNLPTGSRSVSLYNQREMFGKSEMRYGSSRAFRGLRQLAWWRHVCKETSSWCWSSSPWATSEVHAWTYVQTWTNLDSVGKSMESLA